MITLVIFAIINISVANSENYTECKTKDLFKVIRKGVNVKESLILGEEVNCNNIPCLVICMPEDFNEHKGKALHNLKFYNMDHKTISNKSAEDFVIVSNERVTDCHYMFNGNSSYIIKDEEAMYLSENGTLVDEMYNRIQRFYYYPAQNYCIEVIGTGPDNYTLNFIFYWLMPAPVDKNYIPFLTTLYLSVIFLFLVLLINFILIYYEEEILTLRVLAQMSYSGTLSIYFIVRIMYKGVHFYQCLSMTFLLLYWYVSSFLWMNGMAFNLCIGIRKPIITERRKRDTIKVLKKYFWYALYGWGLPLVPTAITGVIQHLDLTNAPHIIKPFFHQCSLSGSVETKLYLFTPISISLLLNFIFFIMTTTYIHTTKSRLAAMCKDDNTWTKFRQIYLERYYLYIRIFLAMGLSWLLEFLNSGPTWLLTMAEMIIGLTGVTIFCIFLLNKKTWTQLSRICSNKKDERKMSYFSTSTVLGRRRSTKSEIISSECNYNPDP